MTDCLMLTSLPIVIRWDGQIITNQFGIDYSNGFYKVISIDGEFDLRTLFHNIRHVMRISQTEKIKVQYRYPALMTREQVRYICLEIWDNDCLNMMSGIINSFSTMLKSIELYVEYNSDESCAQVCDEVGTSNQQPSSLYEHEFCDDDTGESDIGDSNEDEDEDEDDEDDDDDDDEEDNDDNDTGGVDETTAVLTNRASSSTFDGTLANREFTPMFFPDIPQHRQCDSAAMDIYPYEQNTNVVLWNSNMSLEKGMLFQSRDEVRNAAKEYSMSIKKQFQSKETRHNTITLVCHQCDEGCKWRMRATHKKNINMWEITKYHGEHTCDNIPTQDNRNLDSNYLYPIVESMLKADPMLKIRVIMANIDERFKIKIRY